MSRARELAGPCRCPRQRKCVLRRNPFLCPSTKMWDWLHSHFEQKLQLFSLHYQAHLIKAKRNRRLRWNTYDLNNITSNTYQQNHKFMKLTLLILLLIGVVSASKLCGIRSQIVVLSSVHLLHFFPLLISMKPKILAAARQHKTPYALKTRQRKRLPPWGH